MLIALMAALAAAAPGPVNTTPPSIVGTPRSNQSVSANPGTWTGTGSIAYTYQWESCDPQGANCDGLGPQYATQTIAHLPVRSGITIRVVVTASDSNGSASAISAPVLVQGLALRVLTPKLGSVVSKQRFAIVVRATGSGGAEIHLRLTYDHPGPPVNRSGPDGRFRFVVRTPAQTVNFHINATAGADRAELKFTLTVEPRVTAIQELDGGSYLIAPGCRTCVIRDPAGDAFGSPPDIASASSTYRNGWLIHTITTYGPINSGGHTPCLAADWGQGGPGPGHGFSAGCFDGPHQGMIFGDYHVCGPHMDANQDCGSAHIAFPNAHTMTLRFRAAQIGNPAWYMWNVEVLYPGDQAKDEAPAPDGLLRTPQSRAPYCLVREQLRPEPARDFSFGRNRCSQSVVVRATP